MNRISVLPVALALSACASLAIYPGDFSALQGRAILIHVRTHQIVMDECSSRYGLHSFMVPFVAQAILGACTSWGESFVERGLLLTDVPIVRVPAGPGTPDRTSKALLRARSQVRRPRRRRFEEDLSDKDESFSIIVSFGGDKPDSEIWITPDLGFLHHELGHASDGHWHN